MRQIVAALLMLAVFTGFGALIDYGMTLPAIIVSPAIGVLILLTILAFYISMSYLRL